MESAGITHDTDGCPLTDGERWVVAAPGTIQGTDGICLCFGASVKRCLFISFQMVAQEDTER